MRILYSALIVWILMPFQTEAQSIVGVIEDVSGNPLPYVSIAVYEAENSNLVKGSVSDMDGKFEVEELEYGEYILEIHMLGFEPYRTKKLSYQGLQIDLGSVLLKESAQELETVTVKAKKPLITVSAEKMVLNVADNISTAGDDGLELLRKAPGVVVDNNDNISLRGNSGVEVYIDGKRTQMTAEDLASLLRNYDASTIEAIEIITNPSAKYEAEGNAGIINIRLKKNKNYGMNGTANATFTQGNTPKGNGGLSLNYRNDRINIFGNVGARMGYRHNRNDFYREQNGKYFDQKIFQISDSMYYPATNFKLGLDYQIHPKHSVGVQMNGNEFRGVWSSNNITYIGDLDQPDIRDSILIAQSRIEGDRSNYQFNVNYRYSIGEGQSFSMDLDHGRFRNASENIQPNTYVGPDQTEVLSRRNFGNLTHTDIDIYTAKADYERSLFGGKLEVGAKYSDVTTLNDFEFQESEGGPLKTDPYQSSMFEYIEQVGAAYANFNRNITDQISLQAGLRVEHTYSRGKLSQLIPGPEDDIERNYTDFFPSASLSWQYHPKFATAFSYSRRINRPNYQDLNPFEIRLSELSFRKGNPFLNPQYTNAFSINQTLFGYANLSLGYTLTEDFFGQIIDSLDSKRNFITQENISTFNNYTLSLSTPLPLAPWYNGFVSFTGFHQTYTSDYGPESQLRLSSTGFNIYSQHTFTIIKDWKVQLSGWFNKGGVWGGTFVNQPQGAMDVGIQKSFLKGQLNMNLVATDVLRTAGWAARSSFNGIEFSGRGRWEAQTLRLNVTYRFGNSNVRRAQDRKTGLEEEASRLGG
jgi:outer membrane receptor protein involved in Fe transport